MTTLASEQPAGQPDDRQPDDRPSGHAVASARRARVGAAALGVATALFVVRLLGAPWSAGYPIEFPDSTSYLRLAQLGPFRPSFWFGERPVGAPLLFWALARNVQLIVLAQTALYLAAFGWTASVVYRSARSTVIGAVGAVGVLAVAVQPRFALWNTHVLSESLSISTGVVCVGAWLLLAGSPTPRRVTVAWAATAAFAVVRDSNVLVALVFVAPVAAIASWRWATVDAEVRRRLRSGAFVTLVVALVLTAAQDSSGRTRYPTYNVIGERVLVDERLTDYYVAFGMPLDDDVRGRTGRDSWDDGEAFLRAPGLQPLRDWVESRGQWAQATSWVWFAPEFVPTVWRDVPAQLAEEHEAYDLFRVHERLPDSVLPWGLGGPRDRAGLTGWLLLATFAVVGSWLVRRRAQLVVCVVALIATAADVYVSWLGDSVEVSRHVVGAIARLGVVLAATVALGADDWWSIATGRVPRVGDADSDGPDAPDATDGPDGPAAGAPTTEAAT